MPGGMAPLRDVLANSLSPRENEGATRQFRLWDRLLPFPVVSPMTGRTATTGIGSSVHTMNIGREPGPKYFNQ